MISYLILLVSFAFFSLAFSMTQMPEDLELAPKALKPCAPSPDPTHQDAINSLIQDTPPHSAGSMGESLSQVEPPLIPWTFEEAQKWMSTQASKKIWPPLFELLQNLPTDSSFKVPSSLKHYPPNYYPKGATLVVGGCYKITHAGLLMRVLNNGSLLEALKSSSNPAFNPLIKSLTDRSVLENSSERYES